MLIPISNSNTNAATNNNNNTNADQYRYRPITIPTNTLGIRIRSIGILTPLPLGFSNEDISFKISTNHSQIHIIRPRKPLIKPYEISIISKNNNSLALC